ncbi:hypothetical protein HGM15179_012103 [Zosterops borbonicus]|uniref:Uncharacterized protein n=1 Tax=Zosterops borbonicus TaxID=364589 RepID=A0A8K1LI64_9PASS|nr:hypothetical protein HGM15179_012103 [Zosterops borbonicus]
MKREVDLDRSFWLVDFGQPQGTNLATPSLSIPPQPGGGVEENNAKSNRSVSVIPVNPFQPGIFYDSVILKEFLPLISLSDDGHDDDDDEDYA